MKQILLGLLLLNLWSCTSDDSAQSQQASATPESTGAIAGSGNGAPITGESGAFLPPTAPGDHPMVPILTRDFWVFEFYVIDDAAARAFNRGRWFQLNPDGTFDAGHWQEKTSNGSWRLRDEDGKVMLYLDNVIDAEDVQWEVQGVNKEQDTMTWAGVSKTNNAGAIAKVINLLTRPTKAQFGVEE